MTDDEAKEAREFFYMTLEESGHLIRLIKPGVISKQEVDEICAKIHPPLELEDALSPPVVINMLIVRLTHLLAVIEDKPPWAVLGELAAAYLHAALEDSEEDDDEFIRSAMDTINNLPTFTPPTEKPKPRKKVRKKHP